MTKVNVSVMWESDFLIDLDDLLGEPWPDDVPITAENILAAVKATSRRPIDFVHDADLLDERDVVIDITVGGPDFSRTFARWGAN